MSCRILGRTVEQGFLKWLARRARDAGATTLTAEFVPTPKNKPFSNFYPSCGFTPAGQSGDIQLWTLDLASADLTIPDWLDVRQAAAST